mmetsp:Transcript_115139/g.365826  ORF Transcript_115139/g.365826 Transcript_115139/m.365826 type:complete len:583 (+) Transcript_115139:81-1829(+)
MRFADLWVSRSPREIHSLCGSVSRAEIEAALRHSGRKVEAALRRFHCGTLVGGVVIFKREVGLENAHRLLVDFLVRILLQSLYSGHTLGLLNQRHHRVFGQAVLVLLLLADLQDVGQGIEAYADHLAVGNREEVAQGLDAPLLNQVLDVLRVAASSGVADDPSCFLLDVKVAGREQVDDPRDQVVVDHLLDLVSVACRDVGDRPAGLLADALLGVDEQVHQGRQHAALQHRLRLMVVSRDDVADGAKSGRLHEGRLVRKKLHEALADTGLQHGSDSIVRAIGEVGQCPAGVCKHLDIARGKQVRKRLQRRRDPLEGRRGLAAAEVGQRPSGVAHQRNTRGLSDQPHDGVQSAALKHQVAEVRTIACDVPEGPDGLLAHILVRRLQQLHEEGQGALLHDHAGLVRGARGDVRKHPGGLELKVRPAHLLQQQHKAGHDAGLDDLRDGRILLERQQLPELLGRVEDGVGVTGVQGNDHCRHLLDNVGVRRPSLAGAHVVVVRLTKGRRGVRPWGLVDHTLLQQGLLLCLLTELDGGILTFSPGLVAVGGLLEALLALAQAVSEARHGALRSGGRSPTKGPRAWDE